LQVNLLKQKILNSSVVIFLFGELPEKRLRHMLVTKGQLVIWTTQSLALLASASFEEDSYGVVQKDLPAIITALLQLKQILDKLLKAGSYKKSYRNDRFDIKMKNALRSAVKRSLYRIAVTFGQYLNELPLSNDSLQQMQNFLKFKEG
jgi:nucleoporin NDC1